jgi:protein-L-isoaspartate O-methyltransferase
LVARACAQANRRIAAALAALLVSVPALAQDGEIRAPFITTPPEVVTRMLQLAAAGPQDFVIDLGSGDGRIVIAAAREYGARGLGIELEPELVAKARESASLAGVAERARFQEGDALKVDLSPASIVTIYLLPSLLDRLQPRLLAQLRPGSRVVTHAFAMKGWQPDKTELVRLSARHEGQGDESRIFLWVVPAQARGTWTAPGGWQLRIQQNFQQVEVEASLAGKPMAVDQARLEGTRLSFAGPGLAFRGRVEGGRLSGDIERAGRREALEFNRMQ